MKKLICALIGAASLVASATTYIQTSTTGTAPWRPVKDSVSQAHLADSALHAPPSAYADSSRTSGLADSAKRAGWAPLDSGRVRGIVSDTAAALRTGIASAITTSEAYATARISDSLTANARAWTTLTAAKSSIHDTATVLRTYIGSASTTGNAATATKLSAARTIATSGDVTGIPTAFDGTANITIPTALPTLLTAGSAGSATTVPTLTWDAKGRLTAAGSAAISIPHTQINDWSTATSSFLTANQSISLTGAVIGSGATSIATTFANTHLASINQDLTTTSSPTFGAASLGSWVVGNHYSWTGFTGCNSTAWSGYMQSSTETLIGAVSGGSISLAVAQTRVLTISGSLVSTTLPLTVTGLITANGGISGNLTGHASLDIPLTGSVAVTGSIQTTQGLYAASGMVGMYSMYDNIFTIGNNAHNIQVNNTTGETNFIGLTSVGMQGSLTVSGTFTPAVNLRSSNYTITLADQGKMIVSIYTLNLPSLTEHDAGFWCIVNWHVGGGGVKFGPTTSGTNWYLRGTSITTRTSIPFSGIVSWDGYTWYAG